jgi:LmbE family N-acetylglucosaminyl deacetylase
MIIVVAAHPDDEVIGLGAQLPYLREAVFIHVTDGAPADMCDARQHGFETREEYAHARRDEMLRALSFAGIPAESCVQLGFTDQNAVHHLREISTLLSGIFADLRPHTVVTHAYEGGHPDHDAASFACQAARRLLMARAVCPGMLVEFASYHACNGTRAAGKFLPDGSHSVLTLPLNNEQQDFKRTLFSCFVSQQSVLAEFSLDAERFRVAPEYDFRQPPHEGRLYYENFSWGASGEQWRSLARAALREMRL